MTYLPRKKIKKHHKLKNEMQKHPPHDIWGIIIKKNDTTKDIFPYCLAFADILIEKEYNFCLHNNQILASYEVQKGNIIEMSTGEGKTYISVASCLYNILQKEHTHIVTSNPYLTKRDQEIYQKIFKHINISVGNLNGAKTLEEKIAEHKKFISFSTIKTLIFDYLYDTASTDINKKITLFFDNIIIDEVDYTTIDEARTPISTQEKVGDNTFEYKLYYEIAKEIYKNKNFYNIDYEKTNIKLNESGQEYLSNILLEKKQISKKEDLYKSENINNLYFVEMALIAEKFFQKNKHYIVKNNEVLVIDINSGRVIPGRRYQNMVHEFLEVRENIKTNKDKMKPINTITIQNFIKNYKKFSGMSGTIFPNNKEFLGIYNKKSIKIKDNIPKNIKINPTLYFFKKEEKEDFIINEILKIKEKSIRPIMVCTYNIKESEDISKKLKKKKIAHNLINAKNHDDESEIMSKAGHSNSVTITTNMAGRGVDILIGETEEIAQKINENGGLYIIINEHATNKRYDKQLQGRTARQGRNGEVLFLSSIEDDIYNQLPTSKKLFHFRIKKSGQPDRLIDSTIFKIQKKIEGKNYDSRMHYLVYDNIDEEQRVVALNFRNKIITMENTNDFYKKIVQLYIKYNIDTDDIEKLKKQLLRVGVDIKSNNNYDIFEEIENKLLDIEKTINNKNDLINGYLNIYNNRWSDFLEKQAILKRKTLLESTSTAKPENEYKVKSSILFEIFLKETFFDIIEYYIFSS